MKPIEALGQCEQSVWCYSVDWQHVHLLKLEVVPRYVDTHSDGVKYAKLAGRTFFFSPRDRAPNETIAGLLW